MDALYFIIGILLIIIGFIYIYRNMLSFDECSRYNFEPMKIKETTLPMDYDKIKSSESFSATINGIYFYDYLKNMKKPPIDSEKYKDKDPIYTIVSGNMFNKIVGKVLIEYEDNKYPAIVNDTLESRIELIARIDLYDDGTIIKTIPDTYNDIYTVETHKLNTDELEHVLKNIDLLSRGSIESGLCARDSGYYFLNIYNKGQNKVSFPWSYSMPSQNCDLQEKILDLLQINDPYRKK